MSRSTSMLTTTCQISESILLGFPRQARLLILGDAFVKGLHLSVCGLQSTISNSMITKPAIQVFWIQIIAAFISSWYDLWILTRLFSSCWQLPRSFMIVWTTFHRASLGQFGWYRKWSNAAYRSRCSGETLCVISNVLRFFAKQFLDLASVQLLCSGWLAWNFWSFWKRSRIDVYMPFALIFQIISLAWKGCYCPRMSTILCSTRFLECHVGVCDVWLDFFVVCRKAFLSSDIFSFPPRWHTWNPASTYA